MIWWCGVVVLLTCGGAVHGVPGVGGGNGVDDGGRGRERRCTNVGGRTPVHTNIGGRIRDFLRSVARVICHTENYTEESRSAFP